MRTVLWISPYLQFSDHARGINYTIGRHLAICVFTGTDPRNFSLVRRGVRSGCQHSAGASVHERKQQWRVGSTAVVDCLSLLPLTSRSPRDVFDSEINDILGANA